MESYQEHFAENLMTQLKQTTVYRAGLTESDYDEEHTDCTASIDRADCSLNVKFRIPSAGGGTTCLWVKIGTEDLRSLLLELASTRSDMAGTFAECITLATQGNAKILEKIRDPDWLKLLHTVEEFVDKKYFDAPAGKNFSEELARNNLCEVIAEIASIRDE